MSALPAPGLAQGRLGATLSVALVVICIVLFSQGLVHRLVASEMESDGNPILRVLWLPVYAIVLGLAASQWRQMIALALKVPFLTALTVLAVMSFTWSIDPGLSLRRGFSVGMTTLFAYYLACRFSWLDLLRLMGAIWLGLTVLSFVAGLVAPEFARDYEIHIGAWRGFWFEKNTMGGHMSRVAFLMAMLALLDGSRRRVWLTGLALSSLMVLLSTSATALLGLLLGLACFAGGVIAQSDRLRAVLLIWLGATAGAALVAMLLFWPEVILGLLGKDPSLTGRTDIWVALLDAIEKRPWLGYGYGAFWAPDSHPAYWVRVAVDWDAPTAHNGWLDVTLSVGLIGAGLLGVSYVATLARATLQVLDHRFALVCLGFLVQLALFGTSESMLLEQNSLVWITYVAFACLLAKGLGSEGRVTPRRHVPSGRPRFAVSGPGWI